VLAPDGRAATVEAAGAAATAVERGWVSERLGERTPTDVLVQSVEADLPARLGWRIRPHG
jgi:hypothetical protein